MMEFWGFWGVACAATLAVFSIFLRGLFAHEAGSGSKDGSVGGSVGGSNKDLDVYVDQLSEVERDLSRGIIGAEEAERLRLEVSRRLLKADAVRMAPMAQGAQGAQNLPANPAAAAAVMAVVLGASLFLYQRLGAPGYADLPLSKRLELAQITHDNRPSQAEAEAQAPDAVAVQIDAEMVQLMEKLRAALGANPNDQAGLILLARNEAAIGNYARAKEAYVHLIDLQGGTAAPEQHLGLAQAMIAAAGGYVSPEAEAQLIKVLASDPQNGLARYFSGLLAAQTGRPDIGFALWEPLLREGPADAPWTGPIKAGLQDLADRAGVKYQLPPEAKGPTAQDIENAGAMSDEDRQAMIAGMVGQLEERLLGSGGSVEEWAKLITSLGVLGDGARAKGAYEAATNAFSGDTGALEALAAAASSAGVAP